MTQRTVWSAEGYEKFDPKAYELGQKSPISLENVLDRMAELTRERDRLSPAELGQAYNKLYSLFLEGRYYEDSQKVINQLRSLLSKINVDEKIIDRLVAGWAAEFALLASLFEGGFDCYRPKDIEDLSHGVDLYVVEEGQVIPIQVKVLPLTPDGGSKNQIIYPIRLGDDPSSLIQSIITHDMIGHSAMKVFEDGSTYESRIRGSLDRLLKFAGSYDNLPVVALAVLPSGFSESAMFHSLTGKPTEKMNDRVLLATGNIFGLEL